jgi:hypothetical protein
MHTSTRKTANLTLALATSCLLLIAGCSGGGGGGGGGAGGDSPSAGNNPAPAPAPTPTPSPTPTPTPTPTNRAPTITGSAPNKVNVGQQYDFKPNASDPDGDALTFSATNVPGWLLFDAGTGRLAGTPSAADVASYSSIRITVSDGKASAALTIAKLDVVQSSPGAATLNWVPPTVNADGTPLTDLAGYTIRYGTSPGTLNQIIEIKNPGVTSYVVESLTPATWYFAISAVNSQGVESQTTGVAWTQIS